MTSLPVVRAQGTPAERGRQIGRSLGDLIEGSLAFYQRHLERRGVSSQELEELLPYLRAAARSMHSGTDLLERASIVALPSPLPERASRSSVTTSSGWREIGGTSPWSSKTRRMEARRSPRRRSCAVRSGPHTNHYLDPGLAALADPPSAGSRARYARLLELIEERRPHTPQDVMGILGDHGGEPQSICLHPDERAGEEAEAILFSMVCDVELGRMWVAPGNPCVTPYEEIELAGVI